VGKFFDRLQRA